MRGGGTRGRPSKVSDHQRRDSARSATLLVTRLSESNGRMTGTKGAGTSASASRRGGATTATTAITTTTTTTTARAGVTTIGAATTTAGTTATLTAAMTAIGGMRQAWMSPAGGGGTTETTATETTATETTAMPVIAIMTSTTAATSAGATRTAVVTVAGAPQGAAWHRSARTRPWGPRRVAACGQRPPMGSAPRAAGTTVVGEPRHRVMTSHLETTAATHRSPRVCHTAPSPWTTSTRHPRSRMTGRPMPLLPPSPSPRSQRRRSGRDRRPTCSSGRDRPIRRKQSTSTRRPPRSSRLGCAGYAPTSTIFLQFPRPPSSRGGSVSRSHRTRWRCARLFGKSGRRGARSSRRTA